MRRISAAVDVAAPALVHRVIALDEVGSAWQPELRYLVFAPTQVEQLQVIALQTAGVCNVHWVADAALEPGDIVIPDWKKQRVLVLFREHDMHHSLLLTNRCNSMCLMCSQPPTPHDDSWLVEEALDIIRHLRVSPDVIGLSGGEPLLLGSSLRRILDELTLRHPVTRIEVLTNGRLFSDGEIARTILEGLEAKVQWLVPLYGHADFYHDFVVQSMGAFEQTLEGLLVLQQYGQAIQLRIVLIKTVLEILEELSGFIGRNLPFVNAVALMGCEPTGYALANREQCELDLIDWALTLARASALLTHHAVPHMFMNAPLCALSPALWGLAHKSISDWKNVYVAECDRCNVKSQCAGLFSWHESGWKPTKIRAIEGVVA
ncbi:His-Xaa-Ser system radical SAM maturase HxsC [Janthinobacterium sp. PSPC3-1]|uniref:His-Xaa-Ser system radical SAM maturase HxsC n=1 Tax=Janthinobacterium sp. PSPC3-1 TaxID=2804653 RepID=UPI003CFAF300